MSEESDANFNEAMQALIIRVQKNQDLSGTANAGSTFNKKEFQGFIQEKPFTSAIRNHCLIL
jgi:hypothetical protein